MDANERAKWAGGARVLQVIVTELAERGDGVDTPFRRITQYWTLDGELLAEHDPHPDGEKAVGHLDKIRAGGLPSCD